LPHGSVIEKWAGHFAKAHLGLLSSTIGMSLYHIKHHQIASMRVIRLVVRINNVTDNVVSLQLMLYTITKVVNYPGPSFPSESIQLFFKETTECMHVQNQVLGQVNPLFGKA